MFVRPLVVTRFANTTPGLVVLFVGVKLAVEFSVSGPLASLVGWAVCGIGGLLIVRGFRTGVRVNSDSVTVYGYVWSRTIPRPAIVDFTAFPALRWTDSSGRSRWTPLVMFMTSGFALGFFEAHQERCRELLRQELVSAPSARVRRRTSGS